MKYLLLILLLISCSASAVKNAVSHTVVSSNLVTCSDNKKWTRCPNGMEALAPQSPHLAFSDLISGPDVGLGDGLGSGTIVTVWGYNLGESQLTSTIKYCDSAAVCRDGYVYYWKNADGVLPSGPANLYASHGMQEIAFSIPDSAAGAGTIEVSTSRGTSTLPFTVRAGNILHVRSTGNDSTGNGSFAAPFLTVDGALAGGIAAGDTIYIHDVDSGSANPSGGSQRGIYWRQDGFTSTLATQNGFIAYPNTRPTATGTRAIEGNIVRGMVVSKIDVYSSNYTVEDVNGQPSGSNLDTTTFGISTTADGRIVANRLTDITGWCASGSSGGIRGNGLYDDYASNAKIYGNEVYEYGCAGSNKLHHTTYMSVRSPDDKQLVAWEFGWNYLHDNEAKNGIHQYDQNANCGDLTTDLLIHDNVIVNQGGAGISVGLSGCEAVWNTKIYNNVLINVALAAEWDGVDIQSAVDPDTGAISFWNSGMLGTNEVYNNTIIGWNSDGLTKNTRACFGLAGGYTSLNLNIHDNICWTDQDLYFLNYKGIDTDQRQWVTGSNNILYTTVSSPSNATVHTSLSTGVITTDPLLTVTGAKVSVSKSSPAIDLSTTGLLRDIYGRVLANPHNIGAVE